MAKIKALVTYPDRLPEQQEISPDLESFKAIIGGWLEGVASGGDWVAYCDEEGRLKHQPVNEVATAIAHAEGWPGDFLVGTVVFVGTEHRGEDGLMEVDVPARITSRLVY